MYGAHMINIREESSMSKKNCIAMLLAGGEGRRLSPLTSKQAKPAVPFGGHYRIIDFPLSNCVNSGIDTIGVLTQYEAESLHHHIGEGSAWKLPRCDNNGITLLPSYKTKGKEYAGTADAIFKNIAYIDQHEPEQVLILSGDHIYHMDYQAMLEFHLSHNASATISVMLVPWEEAHRFGIMSTDSSARITEFTEKPQLPKSNLASMGIYLFDWQFLKSHLLLDAEDVFSSHDFGKDIIPKMLASDAPLHAYEFNGYWRDVGTINSLWEAHMDLLDESLPWQLHNERWPMFTKEHDYGEFNRLKLPLNTMDHSMIHHRCYMDGQVQRSVIFGGTQVGRNSKINESVIMPNVTIGKHVTIEHAIIGEGAVIKDGTIITGNPNDITVIGPNELISPKMVLRPQPSRILQDVYDQTAPLRAGGLSS